jgi:hypothetical protein
MAPQQPQPEADMAEGAAAEPSRSEPVREEQPEPASAPVASQEPEPAAETRRPEPEPALAAPEPQAAEAKESRGYLNGNGAAHEESEKAEATAAVEETEIEATVVAPPKPRGPKRGWWQRRDPE